MPYNHLHIPPITGNLRDDIEAFLIGNNQGKTADHCLKVGEKAEEIARNYGEPTEAALFAGYLHDISAVYPNNIRIELAKSFGIKVLPEEEKYPMIIHQKISKQMAKDLFNIYDIAILDAIGCHTTLRKQSTKLDKILFVADKIVWDQTSHPPYLDQLLMKLEISLEHAAFEYIQYLWNQKDNLKVIHPWLVDAYDELKQICEC